MTIAIGPRLQENRPARTLFEDVPLTSVPEETTELGARGRLSSSDTGLRAPHWLTLGDYDVARSMPNPRFTAELGVEATPSLCGSPSPPFFYRRSPPPTPKSNDTTPSPTFKI